jgi:glyoxylase-like metal-dependent hydrolase (beta-lactamase superfamily II)
VILLHAGNASEWTGPDGNNTYLLTGRAPALIDAGVGHLAHLDAVTRALNGAALSRVLITHDHADHGSGVPSILERWPSTLVRGGKGEAFRDGERIEIGNRVAVALHTPGHSPDHFCFFDEAHGDLYCGDLVRAGGTVVIPASRGGDLQQYLSSLARVRSLRARRLLPGHGPIIDNPSGIIDDYIAHRAARERQILAAIADGHTTPETIVSHVYGGLSPALVSAAADSVLAHLIKLQREGRLAGDFTDHGPVARS